MIDCRYCCFGEKNSLLLLIVALLDGASQVIGHLRDRTLPSFLPSYLAPEEALDAAANERN